MAGIDLLLASKANMNLLAIGELSPLHLAAARGAFSALNALITAGADLKYYRREVGKAATSRSVRARPLTHRRRSDCGARVRRCNGYSRLNASLGVQGGSHESVALLLGARADATEQPH